MVSHSALLGYATANKSGTFYSAGELHTPSESSPITARRRDARPSQSGRIGGHAITIGKDQLSESGARINGETIIQHAMSIFSAMRIQSVTTASNEPEMTTDPSDYLILVLSAQRASVRSRSTHMLDVEAGAVHLKEHYRSNHAYAPHIPASFWLRNTVVRRCRHHFNIISPRFARIAGGDSLDAPAY